MKVEVIVPWRGDCSYRERALGWLVDRLEWPTTVATAPEGEWSKGAATTPAVERSKADIVIVHDADVHCDKLAETVAAVEDGEPWAMPHERVLRLSDATSAKLIDGVPNAWRERTFQEPPYRGTWGGGIVVLPRETYLSVPLDSRFLGWGCEDISWANALWHLAGPGRRDEADLIHLYHPPQRRMTRQRGSPENHALSGRYRRARFRPNVMRALVNEMRRPDESRDAAQQALPAGTPL